MGKPELIWPGERLRAFFRTLFANEPTITPEVRERLVEQCTKPINRMLVWYFPEAKKDTRQSEAREPGGHQQHDFKTDAPPLASPDDASVLEQMAPWPEPDQEPAYERIDATDGTPQAEPPPQLMMNETAEAKKFDPFAFSIIALYRRDGREALIAQLNQIDSSEDLRQLADAQHLSVPGDIQEPAALRHAIVKGAEQRIADRRAAGS